MASPFWSRPRTRFAAIATGLVFTGGAVGFTLARAGWAAEAGLGQARPAVLITPAQLAERTAGLASLENGFVAIGERMEPCVVSIKARRTIQAPGGMSVPSPDDLFDGFGGGGGPRAPRQFQFRQSPPRQYRSEAGGSGVIVRGDGWILTNDHVVEGADKVTVKLSDGREVEGTVRRDYRSDIALIKIPVTNLPVADFGDSDRVRVGQWAIAFGSPFSLEETMTAGIVSARGRKQSIPDGDAGRFYPSLIQTDASINPGNSGGPLVDCRGRVIGINVAINSPTGGSVGIGFAIPANTARDIMQQLIEKGKVTRGYLGVGPRGLTSAERTSYGVERGGALVESVSEGTPAAAAGFRVEDIVLKVGGQPVEDEAGFRQMVSRLGPGSMVEFLVRRGGKDVTLKATLQAAPEVGSAQPDAPTAQTGGKIGVRVEPMTADHAKRLGLSANATGLVVIEVPQGGPADEAGIQSGDVLVRANGRDLASPADLKAAEDKAGKGASLRLQVLRSKMVILVSVEIP